MTIRERERPTVRDDGVLVAVRAATVTTADWRVRASAFPGGLWLMGRLMMGLFSPRNPVLGGEFAGVVSKVGKAVTRFKPGDRVFGLSTKFGAHAEYVAVPAESAIAPIPARLGFEEAAAIPFGALCALVFLRDFAKLSPGQKILIAGASGGVGVHAVQIAKSFGAEVTAVCSAANHALIRGLGADHVIDYRKQDYSQAGIRYDVIFDTAGTNPFHAIRRALKPDGLFLPLEFGLREAFQAMVAKFAGGPRIMLRVSSDSRRDLETVAQLVDSGRLRPVIDASYEFGRIVDAYRRVESRHKTGSVVLRIAAAA